MDRKFLLDENQKLFEKEYGYIIYKLDENYCDINLIEIDNAQKNNGLGTKLLESFISYLESINIEEIYLDAWVTSTGIYKIEVLVNFYKKFGFFETGRLDEDGQTRVFMLLKINERKAA